MVFCHCSQTSTQHCLSSTRPRKDLKRFNVVFFSFRDLASTRDILHEPFYLKKKIQMVDRVYENSNIN